MFCIVKIFSNLFTQPRLFHGINGENANRRISIDFLLAVMFLFHKRVAFRLREHGYRGSARPDR